MDRAAHVTAAGGGRIGCAVLSLVAIVLLVAVVAGMSTGQILFKLAAGRGDLTQILLSPIFWGAAVLYGLITILWVVLLREVDLSRAYPFVATTYLLVPAASMIFLGEKVGPMYFAGVALIVIGIVLATKG
jgi:drug/metabolite transporter (DMT)-like permease